MGKNTQSLQTNSTLETIVRWGVYAVALVPLIVFNDFFPTFTTFFSPFHFGKVVVLRIWIELLAIAWLLLALKDRSFLPKRNTLLIAVGLWLGAFFISSIF